MSEFEKEQVKDIIPTYRVLTEPIYDIDIWLLRLTWQEAVLTASLWIISWLIFELIGLGSWTILGIPLDSTVVGLIVSLIGAGIISFIHFINPNASIELVILGLKEPSHFVGRIQDRQWKPSFGHHYRHLGQK